MESKRDYLNEAVNSSHYNYSSNGLKARAQPFLSAGIPDQPKKILIVGVALGGEEEINAINHYFPEYEIYGIDVAKSALKKSLNAKLFHLDVANLTFEDNSFAGVMCSAVMHEVYSFSNQGIEKVNKAISEIKRVLSHGGVAVIREFFVPENIDAELVCLTKEAEEFSNEFIKKFRNNFDKGITNRFRIEGGRIYSDLRLLNEIMLHFRVAIVHSDFIGFFESKEIEERYLPLSMIDYSKMLWKNDLEIIGIAFNDFPKYYEIIDKHFKIFVKNCKSINNLFGFTDIIFRK